MENTRNLGAKLKELRNNAGLTQRALGEQLGYSESFISYVEKGLRFLDPKDITKVSQLFKVPHTYLLDEAGTIVNFRAEVSQGQSDYDISDFIKYARRKVNESKNNGRS